MMYHPKHSLNKRRAVALALIIVFVFLAFSIRLFQIQIVEGEKYAEMAKRNEVINVTIQASRGEILDRYMTPMAINRTSFSVVFDKAFFPTGTSEEQQKLQNDIILSLTGLLSENDCDWNDTLPISDKIPYSFLEERQSSIKNLKSRITMAEYATAEQCMNQLVEQYSLEKYTPVQQRIIAGVRNEIDIRQFAIKNPFTFSSDVTEQVYNKILENSSVFTGVIVQPTPVREYVNKRVGAHLLGTVGPIYPEEYKSLKDKGYLLNDTVGKSGVEAALESELRGINGVSTVIRDASGTVVEKKETTPPVPGNTVVTTLDYDVQKATQKALADSIKKLRAQRKGANGQDISSGSVVMLDVKNGGVIVSASWPDFDLSTYNKDYLKLYNDKDRPLFNRALNGAFACGSTMKPGVALAGVTEGLVSRSSAPIFCNRVYSFYASSNYSPTCMGYHRKISTVNAIAESCNVFFYDLGRRIGIDKMNEYSKLFGLGQKTGIEIGEASGILAGPAYRKSIGAVWNPGDTCAAAIGQSDNMFTPIQLAAYAMTIANDGVRYKTHLVKSVRSYDGNETPVKPQVAATVKLSKEAIDTVREGMVKATQYPSGTARSHFSNAPYTVAAKTGTAQPGNKNRSDHGVFIAYAPVENPEVAIAVVLENGSSGPSTALARVVLDAYFNSKNEGAAPTPQGELLP
ncbi:MAG: penicillin-binding transpeptidase domain-containing protein [Oscillospiraceae bacterium]|nr:penicillin-binding transpeptidase domain-containing protein [Oscillospiraceae bacterium]